MPRIPSLPRTALLVCATAVALAAGTGLAATGRSSAPCVYHFTTALDDLYGEVEQREETADTRQDRAFWKRLRKKLGKCGKRLGDDTSLAANAAQTLSGGRTLEPVIDEILREMADDLDRDVESEIARIETFVEALKNAGNDTRKSEQHVADAQRFLEDSRAQLETARRLLGINQAIFTAYKAKPALKVRKAPKSCKGRRLRAGEFCDGLITGALTHYNLGSATVQRDAGGTPTGLRLLFIACNGDDEDLRAVSLFANDVSGGGTFDQSESVGGFRAGLGFELTMKPGSQLTLGRVDLDAGYVEGSFTFTSAGGFVGQGRFRLTQILEQP